MAGCGHHAAALQTTSAGVPAASHLSKKAYSHRLSEIKTEVSTATNAARHDAVGAKSVADVRKVLKDFADKELHFAQEVGKIRPPPNAIKANALLAKGFADTAKQTRALLPKVASATSKKQVLAMLARVHLAGAAELHKAIAELTSLHYMLGG